MRIIISIQWTDNLIQGSALSSKTNKANLHVMLLRRLLTDFRLLIDSYWNGWKTLTLGYQATHLGVLQCSISFHGNSFFSLKEMLCLWLSTDKSLQYWTWASPGVTEEAWRDQSRKIYPSQLGEWSLVGTTFFWTLWFSEASVCLLHPQCMSFPTALHFLHLFIFFFQEHSKYGSGYKLSFNDKFAFIFSFE